jgi:hypothetical protein
LNILSLRVAVGAAQTLLAVAVLADSVPGQV